MSAQPVVISIPRPIELRRILYATDFSRASERALPILSTVARHYKSQVYLAHIWSPEPHPIPDSNFNLLDKGEEKARLNMADLLHAPELQDLSLAVELEGGSPVERIANYVKKHSIDLVVLGTHGRRGFIHTLLGSVAEELLRNLRCTVLTVGPNLNSRFIMAKAINTILFPTNLSPESKAAFPYLASLAAEFSSEIVILHVVPAESGNNPNTQRVAERMREQMQETFGPQLSSKCKPHFVVEFGNVAKRILSAADYYKSDLIGMGVREGNELVAHLRSTAAYRVVIDAECPVLTVRGTL